MANYKQEVSAAEVASSLGIRFRTTVNVTRDANSNPTFSIGNANVRILDQIGNENLGWKDIAGKGQRVFTTGVAQIMLEAIGAAGASPVAGVAAGGSFALTTVVAGKAVTIAGVTLTEGVDFTIGADDNATATSLKAAIDAAFAGILVTAVAPSANPGVDPAIVGMTAASTGTWGNAIAISSNDASMVASGAHLGGGVNATAGGNGFTAYPLTIMTIIAELGSRGLKVELWSVNSGVDASDWTNIAVAVKNGEFDPLPYWPISGRV